ncbi:MAG: CheR family methyltransferase [Kofleriaceae bacterium]
MTDGLWRTVSAHYRAWAGIGLGDRRREPVLVALRALAAELGQPGPDALLAAAARAGGEPLRDRIISRISVGLTWFGRELALLEPTLERARAHCQAAGLEQASAWSAGCSTGEEAYTVAMALVERGLRPRVLATDISIDALATAARGHYPRAALDGVPARWLERYFVDVDRTTVAVAPAIRAVVSFARHNLATDPVPPAGWPRFDLVVCRNVLIYFEPREVPGLAARLASAARGPDAVVVGAVEQAMVGRAASPPAPRPAVRPRPAPVGARSPALAAAPATAATGPTVAAAGTLDATTYLRRGIALRQAERLELAIAELRRARLLDASSWLAPYLLGLSLESLARPGEATEAYRHTLAVVSGGGRPGLPEIEVEATTMAATVAAACHARLTALGAGRRARERTRPTARKP